MVSDTTSEHGLQQGAYGNAIFYCYNALGNVGNVCKFYDNVFVRQRGISSLSWEKPKLKVDFRGRVFKVLDGIPKVFDDVLYFVNYFLGNRI